MVASRRRDHHQIACRLEFAQHLVDTGKRLGYGDGDVVEKAAVSDDSLVRLLIGDTVNSRLKAVPEAEPYSRSDFLPAGIRQTQIL